MSGLIYLINIILSRFMHVACTRISFLFKAEKKFIICICHILSIYLLKDILVVSTLWLLWMMRMNIDVQVLSPFSTILSIYLEMQSLDYIIILRLTFWGTTNLLSTTASSFYIPISNVQGLQFLHILVSICKCLNFWL